MVAQFVVCIEEEVFEKHLHVFGSGVDALVHVGITGSYDGISEIPCLAVEGVVGELISLRQHVLHGIYKCHTTVGVLEGVVYKQLGYEIAEVAQLMTLGKLAVVEMALGLEEIVHMPLDVISFGIEHRDIGQHPFFFAGRMLTQLAGVSVDAVEQVMVGLLESFE